MCGLEFSLPSQVAETVPCGDLTLPTIKAPQMAFLSCLRPKEIYPRQPAKLSSTPASYRIAAIAAPPPSFCCRNSGHERRSSRRTRSLEHPRHGGFGRNGLYRTADAQYRRTPTPLEYRRAPSDRRQCKTSGIVAILVALVSGLAIATIVRLLSPSGSGRDCGFNRVREGNSRLEESGSPSSASTSCDGRPSARQAARRCGIIRHMTTSCSRRIGRHSTTAA